MKWSDLAVVGGTAAATAAVMSAWCFLIPPSIADEGDALDATLVLKQGALARHARGDGFKAELEQEGVIVTLNVEKQFRADGSKPEITVKAVNTSDSPADFNATVSMLVTAPMSEMSRMMPVARPVWSNECAAALGPHETKVIVLPTGTEVKAGSHVSFTVAVGNTAVSVPGFSIPLTGLPAEGREK